MKELKNSLVHGQVSFVIAGLMQFFKASNFGMTILLMMIGNIVMLIRFLHHLATQSASVAII